MNLKELFGKKYRVTREESYDFEREPGKSNEEWRYYEIRGKQGTVYPYNANQLAVMFTSMAIANRYKSRGWKIIQDGDFERIVLFPIEAIHEMAKAIKAKKRKNLTSEQRQIIAERLRLARTRILPKNSL